MDTNIAQRGVYNATEGDNCQVNTTLVPTYTGLFKEYGTVVSVHSCNGVAISEPYEKVTETIVFLPLIVLLLGILVTLIIREIKNN